MANRDNALTKRATELTNKGFTEKTATHPYKDCNSLFINHKAETFWFTTKETAKHTRRVAEINPLKP